MAWFERVEDRRESLGQLTWVVAWLIVTLIGALFLRPSATGHGTHQQLGLPPCPAILAFQRPCPGCGLTTSWTSLLRGDVGGAFRAHPVGPPLYALFTVIALASAYGALRGQRFVMENRAVNVALVAAIVALGGFGAWRFATTTIPLEDALPRWLVERGLNQP